MRTGHSFRTDLPLAKLCGRPTCATCGVARLKNPLTDWVVAVGCDYKDDPGFRRACRDLVRVRAR